MVTGIMGALDIAPTLHFVELALKINGEEWVKAMDEHIVPSCAAFMEPGRKATTRRRTLEFQPVCSPDLKTQLVQRPTLANTSELSALFDPRVLQNVDRQPLDA